MRTELASRPTHQASAVSAVDGHRTWRRKLNRTNNPGFVEKSHFDVEAHLRNYAREEVARMGRGLEPWNRSIRELGLGTDPDLFHDIETVLLPDIDRFHPIAESSLKFAEPEPEIGPATSTIKPDIAELEAILGMPAISKEERSPEQKLFNQDEENSDEPLMIQILDEQDNPANAEYIESLLDLPPQWLQETPMGLGRKMVGRLNSILQKLQPVLDENLHEVEDPEPLEDIDLSDPLALIFIKDKMVSVIKAAKIYVKENMQPVLADGVEYDSDLEPESLTDREVRIQKLRLAHQAVALWVAISLVGQGGPIKQIEAQSRRPVRPDSGQVFDGEANSGSTIDLPLLFRQVTDIINSAPTTISPARDTTQPTVAETTTVDAKKSEENWNQEGAILPANLGPDLASASASRDYYMGLIDLNPELVQVYKQVQQETGVPAVIVAGIHAREGNMDMTKSLISGRAIGDWEPDVSRSFKSFLESAIYGANLLKSKVGGDLSTPAQIAKALTLYNGGGNDNWGKTNYPNQPRFKGDADPYVTNLVDARHGGPGAEMYVRYCKDGVANTNGCPRIDYRPGVLTVAKWMIESGRFNG